MPQDQTPFLGEFLPSGEGECMRGSVDRHECGLNPRADRAEGIVAPRPDGDKCGVGLVNRRPWTVIQDIRVVATEGRVELFSLIGMGLGGVVQTLSEKYSKLVSTRRFCDCPVG